MNPRIPARGLQVKSTVLLLWLATTLSGCASLSYYGQSVTGHFDLMQRREPIPELLADSSLAPELRTRLARIQTMREFASRELGLPDNGSYRSYADLERPYVVWTVVATPPLSLEPREWCFLIVGCLDYRGYYDPAAARAHAAELAAGGADTYIGGASAYSTLGWFDDPVLNTMLHWSDAQVARLIFHELAHQKLFFKNDTAFNEAFADTVGIVGARRWLEAYGEAGELANFRQELAREDQFVGMVMTARTRLLGVYASDHPDAAKLEAKRMILAKLARDYEQLRLSHWTDYDYYDPWFEETLNNAKLAAVATYRELMPTFTALLARLDGKLEQFYDYAEALQPCSPAQRRRLLGQPEAKTDCNSAIPDLAKSHASR